MELDCADIHQCVPTSPEVAVCYDTHSVTQLILYVRWDPDHKPNQFTFDCARLVFRKLVVPILILPIHQHPRALPY